MKETVTFDLTASMIEEAGTMSVRVAETRAGEINGTGFVVTTFEAEFDEARRIAKILRGSKTKKIRERGESILRQTAWEHILRTPIGKPLGRID